MESRCIWGFSDSDWGRANDCRFVRAEILNALAQGSESVQELTGAEEPLIEIKTRNKTTIFPFQY